MPTRQATPGASTGPVLLPSQSNARKRGISESEGATESSSRNSKKLKPEDKKKRRKRKRKISIVAPAVPESSSKSKSAPDVVVASSSLQISPSTYAGAVHPVEAIDPSIKPTIDKAKPTEEPYEPYASQIARLTTELKAQSLLLQRHQAHLTQVQQSLTCQICLDFLHKPFALAPCGHITCHDCLVQWFTRTGDTQTDAATRNRTYIYKQKTCPICRAVVVERPVEVWGVKDMVTNIVRSGLVELPAAAPMAPGNESADPWRDIFRPVRQRGPFQGWAVPPITNNDGEGGGGLEALGMYDREDGGVYRCIDCMHEIWGGMCSNCHRVYPGHGAGDDDDEDDEDGSSLDEEFFIEDRGGGHRILADLLEMVEGGWGGDESDLDDDEDEDGVYGWGTPMVIGEEGIAEIEEDEDSVIDVE